MTRLALSILLPFFLMAAGCPSQESQNVLVPDNPFGHTPPGQAAKTPTCPASSIAEAARFDSMGRRILAANPQMVSQIGARPQFRTIGSPQLEILHQDTSAVIATEGLVKGCKTDGQLAAVICQELGKMLSEREAFAGPQVHRPQSEPPMELRVGNDDAGSFGPADQLHRAELAKYDEERRRKAASYGPPDAQALASTYLTKAGYPVTELDAVAPLLRAAAENNTFTKQLLAPPGMQPAQP